MPRKVSDQEVSYAINLMTDHNLGQRDIERETGLSRPFLRKVAKSIGYQFPRNGVEVLGKICMCTNCGNFMRKPPSKITRAKQHFCDRLCKQAFYIGPNHPMWNQGKTANSFSSWVKNQSQYAE